MAELRKIEPLSVDWQSFSWASGSFDSARRAHTPEVVGEISLSHHLLMVTLSGGAEELEVSADCGHRYRGADFAGAVSFVPAGCARRLRMRDVRASWASITLRPDLLDPEHFSPARGLDIPTFTNLHDPLAAAMLVELAAQSADNRLSAPYCEAMATALCHHLLRRHGVVSLSRAPGCSRLPPWRLRRITDYIEANLARSIHVPELAQLAGLSVGHFHRSLVASTGKTPLALIHERRMQRARQRLLTGQSVLAVSQEVGFASASHFARTFRRAVGIGPGEFRSGARGKQR